MSNEYLPERIDLQVEKDAVLEGGEALYHHLRRLFGQLERYLVDANKEVNNILITGGVGSVFYFGLPGDNGTYSNGTIRIDTSGGTFKVEQKLVGTWEQISEDSY